MRFLKAIAIALPMGLVSAFALADDHSPANLDDVVKMLKAQQEEIEASRRNSRKQKRKRKAGGFSNINTPQSPDSVGAQRSRWSPIGGKTLGSGSDWAERTSLGGYGELHYNNLNGEDGAGDLERTDFHRLCFS